METTSEIHKKPEYKRFSSYISSLLVTFTTHIYFNTDKTKEELLNSLNNLNEFILNITKTK